ncbi:MAG: RNA polymerase sigma factor [Actinomycetota bacterium]
MSKLNDLAFAAGRGDRSAMQKLAAELQAPVWRYAYSITMSREVADEASQETWCRVIRSIPGFKGDSEITTWVLAIARRSVASVLEKSKREAVPMEQIRSHSPAMMPELAIELSRLSSKLMEPLMLTQVVGLSYQETADVIGIKVGTVRSRVFRARAQMVAALKDQPEEDSDGMS